MGIHEALGGKVDGKDLNQEVIRKGVEETLLWAEKEISSLRASLGKSESQVSALKAEIHNLRLRRTDDKLATEVLGLRKAVGEKDRKISENLLAVEKLKDAEAVALHRAKAAEQKLSHVAGTLEAMQRARDASQGREQVAERLLREVAEARDRVVQDLTVAETRIKDLEKSKEKTEKKGKPV